MDIDVMKIAELACLEISEGEKESFQNEMREIAEMVSDLPPMEDKGFMPEPMELMEDVPGTSGLLVNELLRNAPDAQNGCFAVPRTV